VSARLFRCATPCRSRSCAFRSAGGLHAASRSDAPSTCDTNRLITCRARSSRASGSGSSASRRSAHTRLPSAAPMRLTPTRTLPSSRTSLRSREIHIRFKLPLLRRARRNWPFRGNAEAEMFMISNPNFAIRHWSAPQPFRAENLRRDFEEGLSLGGAARIGQVSGQWTEKMRLRYRTQPRLYTVSLSQRITASDCPS